MADINTNLRDEKTIQDVLRDGLEMKNAPKQVVLRIALAKSLQITTAPDESYDYIASDDKGGEYKTARVSGVGLPPDDKGRQDFDAAMRSILSIYHEENLFEGENAEKRYRQLLQRHVRRGLHEIRTTWRTNHDFHSFLYHELFSSANPVVSPSNSRQEELLAGLKEIGVTAQIRDVEEGARISRFSVYLDNVNHLDKVKRGLDKLSLYLGLQEQGVFYSSGNEASVIALDVPRPMDSWQTIAGGRIKEWALEENNSILSVYPGVEALGESYSFDLAKSPHLLVGGTTGSGKSVCLHALLLSLLWRLKPKDLQLCLIDPKKVELSQYAGLPHLLKGQVFTEIENIPEVLENIVGEMERRIDLLAQAGVSNLAEGRESGKLELPYLIVVVEELADLLLQSREIEHSLVRLAQKARATGIHMILATQRPDSATFSGLLRTNIPARIALSVRTSADSKIILDETGAEKLLGNGDMLIRPFAGASAVRVHGAKVIKDDIQACIRAAQGK